MSATRDSWARGSVDVLYHPQIVKNGGLKSEYHGRINRKEAKKWLKNRSGIRKLKDLYIDNELDYLIGFIDYEEICSRR